MSSACIRISSFEARVDAGPSLLALIDRLHAGAARPHAHEYSVLEASAEDGELVFANEGLAQRRLALSPNANVAALQVSRAIVDALADPDGPLLVLHGAALESAGRVLAIVSIEPAVGKTSLALQLLSRGWRIVSDDRVLVDRPSREVLPYHRLLTLRSSAIPFVPRMFRRALEVSPWYFEPDARDVVYIAIDPAVVCGAGAWSMGGPLEGVLFATRCADGLASIETLVAHDGAAFAAHPALRACAAPRMGRLNIGAPTVTADVVETWLER
jgi:hypothetical protein